MGQEEETSREADHNVLAPPSDVLNTAAAQPAAKLAHRHRRHTARPEDRHFSDRLTREACGNEIGDDRLNLRQFGHARILTQKELHNKRRTAARERL